MRILFPKWMTIVLYGLLLAAALYLLGRWVMPLILPFLLAFGMAALAEPTVGRLCRKGLRRGAAAGLCLLGALALGGALLWLMLRRLWREAAALTDSLPALTEAASATLEQWETRLSGLLTHAPELLRLWAEKLEAGLKDSLTSLPLRLSERLPGLISDLVARAPEAALFLITVILGSFFASASYPELLRAGARLLPAQVLHRARTARRELRRTLGRWLRAQMIMLAIMFAVLALAFLLLRVEYALLLALLTALVDALPVLGAGIVLLPWAAAAALTGKLSLGLGLVITYVAVTVLHQSIQAKLLGDQLGLHPLATLISIYAGFRIWGVWGMLVFPILAISLKQIAESGAIPRPGRAESRYGGSPTA